MINYLRETGGIRLLIIATLTYKTKIFYINNNFILIT